MEQQIKQEGPASLSEAWSHGMRIGLELNEAKKQMREQIAHRLQACRMGAKLTQQELGLKININYLTYRGYENCKSDIPIVYLIRLADYYGVSLDYLTGRTDEKTSGAMVSKTADETSTDARIAQLERMVAQLVKAQGKTED